MALPGSRSTLAPMHVARTRVRRIMRRCCKRARYAAGQRGRSRRMRQQRGGLRGRGRRSMLDARRRLIAPSARSDVPPFMVMDVMAAAARIEAAGGRVIHMEVGQPAAPAPAPRDRGRAGRAAVRAARLHRDARHPLAARADRPALRAKATALEVEPEPHRRHHRLVGRIHPGVPGACSRPATGSRSPPRAIRPTAIS